MALEQWEIELQNQLHDSVEKLKSPEVHQEVQENEPEIPKNTIKESQDTGSSIPFMILLMILSIVMLYFYDNKTGGKVRDWIGSHFSSKNEVEKQEKQEFDLSKYKEMYEKLSSEQRSQLDALQNKVSSLRDKVMLMGLLLNENFNILKQDENKDEMVFFNRDWTLDKLPSHIDLSDEDKEYLKKYVK